MTLLIVCNLQIWKVRCHASFEGYGSSTHLLHSLRIRAGQFQASIFGLLTYQVSSIPSHVLHRSEADADKLYHPQNSDYLKNQVFEMFCRIPHPGDSQKVLPQFRSGENTILRTTNGFTM